MNKITGKIIEFGDLECLEDMPEDKRSGLLILASREQLMGGRNLFGEQVIIMAHDNKTPEQFHAEFSAWANGRPIQKPEWPENEDITLCAIHRHKPSGRLGSVSGFDFNENSVTVWFDEHTRWTGTKQDFNAQFGDIESITFTT